MGYRQYLEERLNKFSHQEQVAKKRRGEEARKQQERFRQIYQKVEHQQASVSRQDPHSGRLLKKKMKAVKSLEHRLERENEEMTEFPDAEDAILVGFGENTGLPAGKTVLELALPRLETEDGVLAEQVNLTVARPGASVHHREKRRRENHPAAQDCGGAAAPEGYPGGVYASGLQ